MSYFVFYCVSCSGSITSVVEERISFTFNYVVSVFCLERFPLPLGSWDGLRYFIVALDGPSI